MKNIKLEASIKLVSMSVLYLALSACDSNTSSGGGSGGAAPSNIAPIASTSSKTLIQDSVNISIPLTATDANGDTLTYSLNTQPSSGTATLTSGVVSYTPNAGYSGADSFSFSANDGALSSNVAVVDLTVQPASSFAGHLTKVDGTAILDVTVEAIDQSGNMVSALTSDIDGDFLLKAVTDQELTLKFSSDGFANQVISVAMPALKSMSIPLNVMMIERGVAQTLDIDAGGTLAGVNGASVILSAGSFIDANGNTVTGNITVNITPVDISSPVILAAFPGDFKGILEQNSAETAIVSLGTVEYNFTQNGEAIQLSSGVSAQIELPIFSPVNPQTGSPLEMGEMIELWSLNEDTGVWDQEGMGTVVVNTSSPTGFALRATVTHFTWWNVDYPVESADVDVTLTGNVDGGAAVIHGRVNDFPGFRTASRNVTVGQTVSGLLIPKNQTTCFWVEYLDTTGATAFSDEQCIDTAIAGSTYPLSFEVLTVGSLTLNDTLYYKNSYLAGNLFNIRFGPSSLETSVGYAITAGTLPAGLTLANTSATSAAITGSTTQLGNHALTITGTDSDGFEDTQIVSFSVSSPPPPSISATTIYGTIGDTVARNITVNNNGGPAPTSWIVTNDDGSQVAANITISSAGTLTITGYDGNTAAYLVTAYNSQGASSPLTITVRDIAVSPPILSPAYNILFFTGDTISENLSGANSGAPATSWTITLPDGITPPPSNVTITNAGIVTISNAGASSTYEVKALNGTVESAGMELSLTEDMIIGPCDGSDPFCVPKPAQ